MPNSIEASTATVKQRLEAGASEQELAALIRRLAATNAPGVIRFDPHPLRKLAHDMAYVDATLERALVLSRALTAALPDDAHAWAVRTIAEYLAKNYRDVIVTASRALAGGVESKFILRARAVALMERAEPRAALDDVVRGLAMPGASPTEDRALEGLRAEAERALRAIEAVQSMRDDLIAGRRSAADLFRRWSPFPLGVQDIRDAERGTRVFAKDFEWTIRVSYAVAEVAYAELEQGRIELAREVFAALALVNSQDGYMKTMLAACRAKLGDRAGAIASYGAALALDSQDIVARTNRGELQLQAGEVELALEDLAVAVQRDPEGNDLHANRSRVLAWAIGDVLERFQKLAAIARGPLRLSAELETVRRELAAQIRARLDDARAAVEELVRRLAEGESEAETAARIRALVRPDAAGAPGHVRDCLEARALELVQSERTRAQAVALVRAWTVGAPDSVQAWKARSNVAFKAEDHAEVIRATTKAIERSPDDAVLHLWRGWSLMNRFEPQAALADFERVMAAQGELIGPQFEPYLRGARAAAAGQRVVRELRSELASGAVSAQDLVRRWSPVPLTMIDFREVASGQRRLLDDFEWTSAVTYSIGALAESYARDGAPQLGKLIASALLLVDPSDPVLHELEAACDAMMAERSVQSASAVSEASAAFELTEAQQHALRDALVNAFDGWIALREMVLHQLDVHLETITDPTAGLSRNCLDLITWARSRGKLVDLVVAARNDQPRSAALGELVAALGLSSGAHGALEKIVGDNDVMLDPELWREGQARAEWRVCRIDIRGNAAGTGFLVGPDLVLTNFHVVERLIAKPELAGGCRCRFDHRLSGAGVEVVAGRAVALASDWLIDHSPYSAHDLVSNPAGEASLDELDFALLRLAERIGEASVGVDQFGEPRGWVEMTTRAIRAGAPQMVAILQHPWGRPMKLALGVVERLTINRAGTRIRHGLPTEPGSSGSPMFDREWRVFGLHHSGDPSTVKPEYNQGIPISLILARPKVASALTVR